MRNCGLKRNAGIDDDVEQEVFACGFPGAHVDPTNDIHSSRCCGELECPILRLVGAMETMMEMQAEKFGVDLGDRSETS